MPLYLYGHSMGGMLVLSFALANPKLGIAGVITTSPFLGFPLDRNFGKAKLFVLKSVSHHIEDFVINSMINPTALTKSNS